MRVISHLQRFKDGRLQEEDSTLEHLWDEICVQVQGQEFLGVGTFYDDTVRTFVEGELQRLTLIERQALWLQTDPGIGHTTPESGEMRFLPTSSRSFLSWPRRSTTGLPIGQIGEFVVLWSGTSTEGQSALDWTPMTIAYAPPNPVPSLNHEAPTRRHR